MGSGVAVHRSHVTLVVIQTLAHGAGQKRGAFEVRGVDVVVDLGGSVHVDRTAYRRSDGLSAFKSGTGDRVGRYRTSSSSCDGACHGGVGTSASGVAEEGRQPSRLHKKTVDCFATERSLDDDSVQRSILVIVKEIKGRIEGELAGARKIRRKDGEVELDICVQKHHIVGRSGARAVSQVHFQCHLIWPRNHRRETLLQRHSASLHSHSLTYSPIGRGN